MRPKSEKPTIFGEKTLLYKCSADTGALTTFK